MRCLCTNNIGFVFCFFGGVVGLISVGMTVCVCVCVRVRVCVRVCG